jgi:hypothetical protein
MRGAILGLVLFSALAAPAWAQTPAEPRRIVLADVGLARTADDEGFLGSGAGVSVGVGYRLTPRLTVQALVQRMPYYREVSWLTFDGRVLFGGVEAAWQARRDTVRPFVTAGAGMMHDERLWIRKVEIGPGQSRETGRSEHAYTLSMMTTSGGIDVRVSAHASLRASLRVHGLVDTGDDLAPHVILQPAIGAAWRW